MELCNKTLDELREITKSIVDSESESEILFKNYYKSILELKDKLKILNEFLLERSDEKNINILIKRLDEFDTHLNNTNFFIKCIILSLKF